MVSAQTAEVTLKGKVIDAADGYPIIGASVVVDGTKLGAITDVDGNFELKIPNDLAFVDARIREYWGLNGEEAES